METAADKLRDMVRWLDHQYETFNDHMKSVVTIEQVYDACERHSIEFADSLYWEDTDDEEYKLAVEVNKILGEDYYITEEDTL